VIDSRGPASAPALPKVTLSRRILAALSRRDGQSDHDLAIAIDGHEDRMARIGSECRHLAQNGQLTKRMRADGIMGNFLRATFAITLPTYRNDRRSD